jgi:hypothetical protein
MNTRTIFAISVALSLVSSAVAAKLYDWPWLRAKEQHQALIAVVAPHMFFRFIGLSFLVVGVISRIYAANATISIRIHSVCRAGREQHSHTPINSYRR